MVDLGLDMLLGKTSFIKRVSLYFGDFVANTGPAVSITFWNN